MQLICPSCGAEHQADGFLGQEEAAAVITALMDLPHGLGKSVMRYLVLFKPKKQRLRWARAQRLVGELRTLIDRRAMSAEAWRAGLDEMLELRSAGKIHAPMESHQYLLKVVETAQQRLNQSDLRARMDADDQRVRAIESGQRIEPHGGSPSVQRSDAELDAIHAQAIGHLNKLKAMRDAREAQTGG